MRKQRLLTFTFIISLMEFSSIFAQISYEVTSSGKTFKDTIKSIVTVVDNEGNKTEYVNTIQTINAEQVNFIKLSSPWTGYLKLDGDNDYAQTGDHPELDVGDENTENLTVEAWINFSQFGSSDFIKKGNAYILYTTQYSSMGYTFKGLGFWLYPGRMIQVATTQYGGGGFWVSGWHHVAGVYNQTNGELMLYMDGEQLHSWVSGANLIVNSNEPFQVGLGVAGQIDEVRISDNIRYSNANYSVPTSPFEHDEHTRALWHFDESGGATQCHDGCGVDNLLICYNGAHIDIYVSVDYSSFEIPEDYQLYQNYPNPFNPSTRISYSIPQISFVSLKVYDIIGNEITILVNEEKPTGSYTVQFDGSNFASGVYFYQLRAGTFVETRKIILLR